jgi:hypothetical protein
LILEGRREWVRAFPRWFERYLFAGVRSRAPEEPEAVQIPYRRAGRSR